MAVADRHLLFAARALRPVDTIKVEAAIGQVAHRPLGPRPGQVGQVDVGDGQRFDILARLCRDPVAGEGKVARGQDARLGVLDVHILDAGQVADIAAHHHETLVLDRARLGAIAHAHIALAAVGAEGDEDDPRAFIHQPPREFGKFAVVTDQHADGSAIGLDHIDAVAALDLPPIGFVGGRVNLFLGMDRSVAQADIGDILDLAIVGIGRVRPADDVDIVGQRQIRQPVDQRLAPAGQPVDRLGR